MLNINIKTMSKFKSNLYNFLYVVTNKISSNFAMYYMDRKRNLIFWLTQHNSNFFHSFQLLMLGVDVENSKRKLTIFLYEFIASNGFCGFDTITKNKILTEIYESLDYYIIEELKSKVKHNFYFYDDDANIHNINVDVDLNHFTKDAQDKLMELKKSWYIQKNQI